MQKRIELTDPLAPRIRGSAGERIELDVAGVTHLLNHWTLRRDADGSFYLDTEWSPPAADHTGVTENDPSGVTPLPTGDFAPAVDAGEQLSRSAEVAEHEATQEAATNDDADELPDTAGPGEVRGRRRSR